MGTFRFLVGHGRLDDLAGQIDRVDQRAGVLGASHGENLALGGVLRLGFRLLDTGRLLLLQFPFLGVLRGRFLGGGRAVRVGFLFALFRFGHFADQLLQLLGELLGGDFVNVLELIGGQSDFLEGHFQRDFADLHFGLFLAVAHQLGRQEGSDSFRDGDALELDADFGTWWLHLLGEGQLLLLLVLLRLGLLRLELLRDHGLWLMEAGAHHGDFLVRGLHHLGWHRRDLLLRVVVHHRNGEDWSRHLAHHWLRWHLLGQMGDGSEGTDRWDRDQDLTDGFGVFVSRKGLWLEIE